MLDFLYETKEMRGLIGKNWCGPEKLPHAKEVRIAKFKKIGSDGHDVELYCIAMPAQFFTIKALGTKNSDGYFVKEFALTTGSG